MTSPCPIASWISESQEDEKHHDRLADKAGIPTDGSNWRLLAARRATYEALSEKAAIAGELYLGKLTVREFRERYAAADSKAVRAAALALECQGSACR